MLKTGLKAKKAATDFGEFEFIWSISERSDRRYLHSNFAPLSCVAEWAGSTADTMLSIEGAAGKQADVALGIHWGGNLIIKI